MDELTKIGTTWPRGQVFLIPSKACDEGWARMAAKMSFFCTATQAKFSAVFRLWGMWRSSIYPSLNDNCTQMLHKEQFFNLIYHRNNASVFILSFLFRVLYHYDVMHIINCQGKLLYPRTVSEDKFYRCVPNRWIIGPHRCILTKRSVGNYCIPTRECIDINTSKFCEIMIFDL